MGSASAARMATIIWRCLAASSTHRDHYAQPGQEKRSLRLSAVALSRSSEQIGRMVDLQIDHQAYEDPLTPASMACAIEVARRRTGIESVIGHMKSEGHLGRCYLSATSWYGGIATVDAVPRLRLCTEELNRERDHAYTLQVSPIDGLAGSQSMAFWQCDQNAFAPK
jgi:hypothetical protein